MNDHPPHVKTTWPARTARTGPEHAGPLVRRHCPACAGADASPFHVERGWRYVRCRRCRTIYLSPRPAPEAVMAHYDDYLPPGPDQIAEWGREQDPVIRRAVRLLRNRLPSGAPVLDVGCGFGFLVAALTEAGLEAEGADLSETGLAHARSRGLTVHQGALEDLAFPAARFSGVTAFYVIEHLDDPGAFLAEAARVLKPGGLLLLRWPQSGPLVRWCRLLGIRIDLFDAPSHLTDFTPESLRRVLIASGFQDVRTWPGGSTRPTAWVPRVAGVAGALVGDALFHISAGRFLAPGASKTTVATKG